VIENNRWLQIPGFWSNHNRIDVDAGVQHVMIRNNFIESTDSTGIAIDTFHRLTWPDGTTVTRTSTDVRVLNNTITDPDLGNGAQQGKKGCFIEVTGTTMGAITLMNNLYVAPKLDTTAFTAAAVRVLERNDLNNFTAGGVANNDWPRPANANTRGVNYVSDGSLVGNAAYYTPAEWASSFPVQVSGDQYENLQISDLSTTLAPPGNSLAATGALPAEGVFTDLYGMIRTGSTWSNGAVQDSSAGFARLIRVARARPASVHRSPFDL
jgi:hypothetical protein